MFRDLFPHLGRSPILRRESRTVGHSLLHLGKLRHTPSTSLWLSGSWRRGEGGGGGGGRGDCLFMPVSYFAELEARAESELDTGTS